MINYLLPRDIVKAMARYRVTGLTAVPPLWIQLAQLDWPAAAAEQLRYWPHRRPHAAGNTCPAAGRAAQSQAVSDVWIDRPSLDLSAAGRDRPTPRLDRAIPNAEILVVREDGTLCDDDEPGELVHRGALVGMGYWNDAEKTAERYRALPANLRESGLTLPEIAVFRATSCVATATASFTSSVAATK